MRIEPPLVSHPAGTIERPVRGERRLRLRRIARANWAPIAAISLALHLMTGILLWRAPAWLLGKPPAEQRVYAQVELVDLPLPGVGNGAHPKGEAKDPAPQTAAPPPTQQSATPPPVPQAVPAPIPAPVVPAGEAVVPPPAPPAPPVEAVEAAAAPPTDRPVGKTAEPPQTRLDESEDLGRGLVRNAIPAGPDSTVHNDPPSYPRLAARYGEAGTVRLMVLVAPDGSARDVQVTESSGYERLDHAARDAVAKWHFRAAQQDGIAVESYYPVNVQFDLGNK